MNNIKFNLRLSNPCHLLATGFGSGLSPIVPGTIGSVTAISFWLLMYWLLPVWFSWLIVLIGFIIGVIICQRTSNDIKVYDHSSIVWDEFIGMWMILMVIRVVNWQWIFIAFILFRFFDILKPWPINWFHQQLSTGWGIMLDDITAAIFAIISMRAISYWLPIF